VLVAEAGDHLQQGGNDGHAAQVGDPGSIARALVAGPDVLVCDEPVSALDVSVQAQILNLIKDLKARFALTVLFIAHDLAVVRNISDRVAVMYLGKLCEIGASDALYGRAAHPYTRALLAAVPPAEPGVSWAPPATLDVEPASPVDPPSGCRFRTRCPLATERCARQEPQLRPVGGHPDHYVACHHAESAEPPAADGRPHREGGIVTALREPRQREGDRP
jgi:peptide/nickel transport system ATP-binding protein